METLWCWVYGDEPTTYFSIEISKSKTLPALREAIKDKKPVDFGHVDPDKLALYAIPAPDNDEHLEKALKQWKLSDASKPLASRKPLSHLELSSSILIVYFPDLANTVTLNCWVCGSTPTSIFKVKISDTKDVSDLRKVIKNENLVDFAHIDPHKLALSSIRISDDYDLHENELKQWMSNAALRRLHPLQPLSRLSLNQPGVIIIIEPPMSARSQVHSASSSFLVVGNYRAVYAGHNKPDPPSSAGEAKTFSARQNDDQRKIDCNRPPETTPTIPVTLLHPVFSQFLDDCRTNDISAEDNAFTLELSREMSRFYDDEESRARVFRRLFREWGLSFTVSKTEHGYVTDGDLNANGIRYAIAEIKNEVGSKGAEPYNQAILYHFEWTRDIAKKMEGTCLPCMLILAFGPYIAFVGAAWNLRPTAEILSFVLPLHYHPSNTNLRMSVARHLVAFKKAVQTLDTYYRESAQIDSSRPQPQMFPYRTHFDRLEGEVTLRQDFEYTRQPLEDKLIFFATLSGDDHEVCVKFVRQYSKEAHEVCVSLGCAPKLHAFEALPGGWFMVVMEKLASEEYDQLWDVVPTEQRFDMLESDLCRLHQAGYVHGDVRNTNIMVSKYNGSCMLVDFDWAGKIGEARYPQNVNRNGIDRPHDAVDGELIKAEHDMEMLGFIRRHRTVLLPLKV